MSAQLKIELTAEAQETLRVVKTLPEAILLGIAVALTKQNLLTVSHIQKEYLSFSKSGPVVDYGLRVQSGRGRSSVRVSDEVTISGQTVQSAIGSNVAYMAVHEFGYSGPQKIPAHVRKVKTRNVVGRIGERKPRQIVAQGVGFVKAFTRNVDYPARAFVQGGIADRADNYSQAISAEIQRAWEGGKP